MHFQAVFISISTAWPFLVNNAAIAVPTSLADWEHRLRAT